LLTDGKIYIKFKPSEASHAWPSATPHLGINCSQQPLCFQPFKETQITYSSSLESNMNAESQESMASTQQESQQSLTTQNSSELDKSTDSTQSLVSSSQPISRWSQTQSENNNTSLSATTTSISTPSINQTQSSLVRSQPDTQSLGESFLYLCVPLKNYIDTCFITVQTTRKRVRRTKAQIAANEANPNSPANLKKRAKSKTPLSQRSRSSKTASQSSVASSQKTRTTSSQSKKTDDTGVPFERIDFKYICAYLEDPKHYTELFGDGSQTSVGPAKLTKAQAFNHFADYMNANNKSLKLTGT
jgi:hypothetical protein